MKKLLFALLYAAGVTRFAAWWNRQRVVILNYHGVTERLPLNSDESDGLHVSRDRFVEQLSFLQRNYRIISLSEYLRARREGRPLPPYSAILTFDDGFRNFLTVAAPLLSERNIPAAMFLITDRMRNGDSAALPRHWTPTDDKVSLSWAEVRELQRAGHVEFGSHTCSHPRLPHLTAEEIEREVRESRTAMALHLKNEPTLFAYPYGKYSDLVVEAVRSAGYTCALTVDGDCNQVNDDLLRLSRIPVASDSDDEAAFAARVSGLRWWWWLIRVRAVSCWRVSGKRRMGG